jgi:glycine/D-amino acid oxidase-like deaminating enzyme
MQVDCLIIGQGLAGSLLAWELLRRNCKVAVVDNGKENASLVAAGIINPITGMRFAKTANVDTLLPVALDCYNQLSAFFHQRFYMDKPMIRVFRHEAELVLSTKRQGQVGYAPYLGSICTSGHPEIPGFATPYGYIEQRQTGHLLTAPLLAQLQKYLIGQNAYRQATVNYNEFHLDDAVQWQDIQANRVIYCEGHQGSQNPWFSWLPFQPVKGEIMTLSHQTELPDAMLNYGNWLLPLSPDTVRIGATFDRINIDTQPSEQGKQTLLATLKPHNPRLAQATVVQHQAGIRPCTADKYPFVGKHPQHPQIAIFNGFGAKGGLQIPWYSQRFADYLLHHKPLPPSCDIQRFQSAYFAG